MKKQPDFNAEQLGVIFENVKSKKCNVPSMDLAFDIMIKGKFEAELFHSFDKREWHLIQDNFPFPRKAYVTSFPVNDLDTLIKLFGSVGITLVFDTGIPDDQNTK
jgi:glycerophosphoryl diester phosphodiesterase